MPARVSSQSQTSGAPIRILFIGTPDFAVTALEAIFQFTHFASDRMQNAFLKFQVVGVVTQPDRPVGREQKLTPPPVKILAGQHDIPVLQPEKLRDLVTIQAIRDLQPDLIVVVVYSKIIPKEILDIPRYGAINVHPSLLPKHRGPSPTKAALLAGDTETGITIMLMDEQMDHGPILAQERVSIAPDEADETLFKKLAPIGARLLVKTIPQWVGGEIVPQEQHHATATYSKLLTREDGRIDWSEPAEVIERKIRAFSPWPGTWTTWNGKRFNILKTKVISNLKKPIDKLGEKSNQAGIVIKTKPDFAVQCGSGALEILELQLEGKKPASAKNFLHGHPDLIGSTMD